MHEAALDPKQLSALIVKSEALTSLADINDSVAFTAVPDPAPGLTWQHEDVVFVREGQQFGSTLRQSAGLTWQQEDEVFLREG